MPLEIGTKVKYSNTYLQILRGNYRKKAEGKELEVIQLNEISVTVRPWGSTQKYGTQHPRRYVVPVEETVTADQDLYCRFCLKPITKDSPGAVADIDPVTNEHSGYRHEGCQPDMKATDSSTPTPVS
jgi:hypothetical protein